MNIDLRDFQDDAVSSVHVDDKIHPSSLDINGRNIKFIEPIRYEGDIYKVGRDRLVHINIYYKYEEACGRCLESYIMEDNTVLTGKLVEETGKESYEEEGDLIYYTEDKLDLSDDIMDMVILSLPMKPLCNKKCKGLCPKCGINLNENQCDCEFDYVDPRFEKLKDLFPKE